MVINSVERFDWNWFETEEFEYFIDCVVPNLKRLYLTGGEPTLINMNRVILDKLIEVGNNKCYVCWTTNLTNWPPEFYDKLDFFDASEVQMSIDGFEMSNTYMRYPTNWKWIEQNQRRRVDFAPIYLESPDWIHSCIWPTHVKEEVCEELQFETSYKNATQSIINYTMNTNKYSKERLDKMVYYISILDKYRKHKFKDIFPELDFIIQHETAH